MKYIRTKDGRIVKVEEHMMIKETTIDGVQKCFRLVYKDRPFTCVLRGDEDYIIKQANTIEELCDCFSCGIETVRDISVARGWNINNRQIYGCILTNKGLIYVAEMNEKGDLELL